MATRHSDRHFSQPLLAAVAMAVLAALLVLPVPARAEAGTRAAGVPDLGRTGSVTVRMLDPDTQRPVVGGSVTLYRVGSVVVDDADCSYVLDEAFAQSGESLGEGFGAELAARLASFAGERGLSGVTAEVGAEGRVRFGGLEPGLYLVTQDVVAEGYFAVSPFLVSVPVEEDGAWVYDVDATPKMELLSKATPPGDVPPDEPQEPTTSGGAPNTGEPESPVGGFVLVGAMIVAGALVVWRLTRQKRRD